MYIASADRSSKATNKILFCASSEPILHKLANSECHQEEYDSRSLWHNVTKAILRKDLDCASDEKSAIEENQRRLSKERQDRGNLWEHRFFEHDINSDQYKCKLNVKYVSLMVQVMMSHSWGLLIQFTFSLPSDPKQALEELNKRVFGPAASAAYSKFWLSEPNHQITPAAPTYKQVQS